MRARDLYDYITSTVPIVIATAVAIIALRQWRTSHEQLRLEQMRFEHQKELDAARFAHERAMADLEHRRALFDRRTAVVEAFREYLGKIYRDASLKGEDLGKFNSLCVRPAQHLFSAEVSHLLNEYLEHGFQLERYSRRTQNTRDEETYDAAVEAEDAALRWLTENNGRVFDAFAPFLNLAEAPPTSVAGPAAPEGELPASPSSDA